MPLYAQRKRMIDDANRLNKPSGERASTRNRGLTTFAPFHVESLPKSCYIQVTTQTVIPLFNLNFMRRCILLFHRQFGSSRCSSNSGCSHSLRCNEPRLPPPVLVNPGRWRKWGCAFECGINYRHAQKITPGIGVRLSPFSPYRCGCTLLGLPGR